jgi:hypothetical protein
VLRDTRKAFAGFQAVVRKFQTQHQELKLQHETSKLQHEKVKTLHDTDHAYSHQHNEASRRMGKDSRVVISTGRWGCGVFLGLPAHKVQNMHTQTC